MKICCIDDDNNFLNLLKDLIVKYSIKNDIDIIVESYNSIPQNISTSIDAFFLDIMMNDNTIFEFVSHIRDNDLMVPIVFFSNYDSFVFESTKFNIFDFIRKKYIHSEFNMMMDKLVRFRYISEPFMYIKTHGIIKQIKISKILYLESFSHTTIIHMNNESLEIKKGVKELFQNNIKYFCRIHRSYYVNINYLEAISKNKAILSNNVILPIGKTYLRNVEECFFKTISNKLEL